MDIEKIYIDMDGVLADFDGGIRNLCHREPVDQMTATSEENMKLWDAVRKVDHFYDKLEIMPGSDVMLRTLFAKYKDRCEILTGIPKPDKRIEHAGEDKQNWMARYFGSDIKVNIVLRSQKKERCKGIGCVLIDDYQKNIDQWVQHGGTGILFTDVESTMKELERLGIL